MDAGLRRHDDVGIGGASIFTPIGISSFELKNVTGDHVTEATQCDQRRYPEGAGMQSQTAATASARTRHSVVA